MKHDERRPHVVMLLSNGYDPDVRAQKEAHILALAGYKVTVVAWDRSLSHAARENEETPSAFARNLDGWIRRSAQPPEPVSIVRVRVRAGWRRGPSHFVPRLLAFWIGALIQTMKLRPAIIHAHQLDTLPLAYAVARAYRIPIVYDAREYYAGMLETSIGKSASGIIEQLDRWLSPRADAILAVGERQAARHRAMGGRVWIVHNTQPAFEKPDDAARLTLRRSFGVPDRALLVVYVGNLTPDRLLTPVLEAVTQLPDVFFVIAGDGPCAPEVHAAAARCDRIRALGRVPLARVGEIVAAGDVAYYGLNGEDPNTHYFLPNLAFFAFAAARPLLVTSLGEVAEIVARDKCGVVMTAPTAAAAVAGLQELRDESLRAAFSARARELGQAEFGLVANATRLLDAYDSLPTAR